MIQQNRISPQRWIAFSVAGIVFSLAAFHTAGNLWLYMMSGVALFLGVTDFGIQCPLLLSVHHLLARIRKKN